MNQRQENAALLETSLNRGESRTAANLLEKMSDDEILHLNKTLRDRILIEFGKSISVVGRLGFEEAQEAQSDYEAQAKRIEPDEKKRTALLTEGRYRDEVEKAELGRPYPGSIQTNPYLTSLATKENNDSVAIQVATLEALHEKMIKTHVNIKDKISTMTEISVQTATLERLAKNPHIDLEKIVKEANSSTQYHRMMELEDQYRKSRHMAKDAHLTNTDMMHVIHDFNTHFDPQANSKLPSQPNYKGSGISERK